MPIKTTKTDLRLWPRPFAWLGRLLAYAGVGDEGAGDAGGDDDGGDDAGGDDGDDFGENMFGMDPDEVDDADAGDGGVKTPAKPKTKPKAQAEEEDEDEEDDDLEDDDEEDEENDEDEDEGEEDDEDDDVVALLTERWDAKLERLQAAGGHAGPAGARVALGAVKLKDEAFARYKAALEKDDGDDSRATAEAMFEIAMDAVIQSLGEYHANAVTPEVEAAQVSAASLNLDRKLEHFLETPEGAAMEASPKIKKAMGDLFNQHKAKFGWRLAMQVPYKDYFRMAGGKPVKGKAAKAAAGKGEQRTSKKKNEALAAARQPRGRRSAAAGARRGKAVPNAQRESDEYIRATSRPFFTVS
jgi:hypothetical protein